MRLAFLLAVLIARDERPASGGSDRGGERNSAGVLP